MRITDVDLIKITVAHNRRPVSKAAVKSLAESILAIGLQNPIGITEDYRLIHGRHRLEAYRELGWKQIPASIHDMDELHAQLAEIDENIQRKQLTAAEECKALARRKEIYLTLHPETKHGGAPGAGKGKGKGKKETESVSFVSDTAAKTGKSKTTVTEDVALGNALPDEIVEKIADTPVANNKSELKKLAKLDAEEQQTVADLLSDGSVSSVTEALTSQDEPEAEPEPSDVLLKRLQTVVTKWQKEYRGNITVAAAVLENLADILRSQHKTTKKKRAG